MKKTRIQLTLGIIAMLCLLVAKSNAQTPPHLGQYYTAGGGIVVKLSGGHGICATADSLGACVRYSSGMPSAISEKTSCHAGGFSDWRIPSRTELDDYVYPHSISIPGVLRCPRPSGNGGLLPPYCTASSNQNDCKCNYWSSTPAGPGAQQQASFYTNGDCINSCPVNDYCHVILVRDF